LHFKIITVAVELKSYSKIKGINSIKSWACDLGKGKGGCMMSNWWYSCLAMLVIIIIVLFLLLFSVVSQWIGCQVVPYWLVLTWRSISNSCGGA